LASDKLRSYQREMRLFTPNQYADRSHTMMAFCKWT